MFGCYLSDYLRSYDDSGRLLSAMYEDWNKMYEKFQERLADRYAKNPPKCCPQPTEIIIYEGDWGSLNGKIGYPTVSSRRYYPPKAETFYEDIQRKYFEDK